MPWQPNHRGRVRPFEPTIDIQSVRIAAQGIKVVHEGVEDRKEQFDQAKELIAKRGASLFPRSGYPANVNLERIGVADFVPNKACATEVGLTQTEFNEAQGRYGDITTNQAAIIALFRVINRYVGNLPPMPRVFPDYPAPVVRNAGDGRELT